MSAPHTEEETRKWAKESHFATASQEFAITEGTLADVARRLDRFSKKYLIGESSALICNGPCFATHNAYRPTLRQSKNAVALFLQQSNSYTESHAYTKEGGYIFFLEVQQDGKNLRGFVRYPTMNQGNLGEDAIGWATGKGEMCPQLD